MLRAERVVLCVVCDDDDDERVSVLFGGKSECLAHRLGSAPVQCSTDRSISVCVRFHPTRSLGDLALLCRVRVCVCVCLLMRRAALPLGVCACYEECACGCVHTRAKEIVRLCVCAKETSQHY